MVGLCDRLKLPDTLFDVLYLLAHGFYKPSIHAAFGMIVWGISFLATRLATQKNLFGLRG